MLMRLKKLGVVIVALAASTMSLAADKPAAGAASGAVAAASPHTGGGLAGNWNFLDKYCTNCHNSTDWAGGVAFDTMTSEDVGEDAEVWEEVVRRLRGVADAATRRTTARRCDRKAFYGAMEQTLDSAAAQRA